MMWCWYGYLSEVRCK